MVMTHYMELLSLHSPWFLILFMAVPVVFIETIFMAEAFSLLGSGKEREKWQTLSHRGGLFFSLYFIVAALYLVTRYIPTIEWRGPIDLIAVWSYVLGIIPAARRQKQRSNQACRSQILKLLFHNLRLLLYDEISLLLFSTLIICQGTKKRPTPKHVLG